ncbi:NAD-dependent epimerase/dehydratase family protein [Devosia nitrariae]|uniref:Oxidoreductase n=1 Tax=Devosia nitrariae TaxID=2071872 RepID=A0ABQ5W8D0_9HYPH|nr:NAD(P)-dependent oxidoreductase [Devosia nitrariae]GLQ55825.1 oxidoreductase [Devosia nitrariae]
MKIAVTGASGGIGRAIVAEAERRGHGIVGIDRAEHPDVAANDKRRFILAGMENYETLVDALAGCDAVIHMAAIPSPGRHPDHVVHNNNVVGSYNILQAAAENGIKRICQASSVNAIGHSYSRKPRYDYFPIDEKHPNYSEDPYSLSKWICEQQADSFVRRYPDMVIASMRFHFVCDDKSIALRYLGPHSDATKHLWAYTRRDAAADACLLSLQAPFTGHEVFYIVAPDTTSDTPSRELAAQHLPEVPLEDGWNAHRSFFDSSKAERMLGWKHGNVDPRRL